MNRNHVLAATLLLALTSNASATSVVSTVDTILGALAGTVEGASDATSSLREGKIVRAARDDAASFVASSGAIRSAQLEAALLHIRSQAPSLSNVSDLELAEAILTN